MIDLYSWPTPNGYKVSIMLEECGLDYRAHGVDIGAGAQFDPDFLRISPNNKIPAIVDHDGPAGRPISLFESGAILLYLAEKTGRFLPEDPEGRWSALQWLFWQMGGLGPMLGQAHHFRSYAPEQVSYAVDRYTNEARRLYNVLDRRLGEAEWLAGDSYSIADMAAFPWTRSYARQGQNLADFPNVERWFAANNDRPAVQRGLEVLAARRREGPMDARQREILFGSTQYARR